MPDSSPAIELKSLCVLYAMSILPEVVKAAQEGKIMANPASPGNFLVPVPITAEAEALDAAIDRLASKPDAPILREAPSDEQCDAVYEALHDWACNVNDTDYGLPFIEGGGKEAGREVIRQALASSTPPDRDAAPAQQGE